MCLFGGSKKSAAPPPAPPPPPVKPPEAPTMADPDAQGKRDATRKREASARGRSSTVLTSPLGDTTAPLTAKKKLGG